MFSVLSSTFPDYSSLCLSVDSSVNSFAFVCHYLLRVVESSESVLFISFRDVLDTYKNALKKNQLDWSKVSFFFNSLPSSEHIIKYDSVVIDGVFEPSETLLDTLEQALCKKFLICLPSDNDTLTQFIGRRSASTLFLKSLSTGISAEYDGCITSQTGDEYLFKFGDQSLALTRRIK
jgi:hypothetical protein